MNAFTQAFLEAALWSSTDDNGTPLDASYTIADFDPDSLDKLVGDCERFQAENADTLESAYAAGWKAVDPIQAGHDFWLTRNGHGCGFWDGDWPEPQGSTLTIASKSFPEVNLYVDDDGKIRF